MRKIQIISRMLMCWFLLWGTHINLQAQYNPDNPPEPQVLFHLVVKASPEHMGEAYGSGTYYQGDYAWVSTNPRGNSFKFLYWTKNGEKFSTEQYLNYKVETDKDTLVAHYKYQPGNPDEPSMHRMYKLFLKSQPEGCCSFNLNSGEKRRSGDYVYLNAHGKHGYKFMGWYEGDTLRYDYSNYNFQMPEREVKLVAKFKYSPENPDDPNSDGSQQDIDNPDRGDANNDGIYSIEDASIIANLILNFNQTDQPTILFDANNDGVISIGDVVNIINKSQDAKK